MSCCNRCQAFGVAWAPALSSCCTPATLTKLMPRCRGPPTAPGRPPPRRRNASQPAPAGHVATHNGAPAPPPPCCAGGQQAGRGGRCGGRGSAADADAGAEGQPPARVLLRGCCGARRQRHGAAGGDPAAWRPAACQRPHALRPPSGQRPPRRHRNGHSGQAAAAAAAATSAARG